MSTLGGRIILAITFTIIALVALQFAHIILK